jgi:hypothetical protein
MCTYYEWRRGREGREEEELFPRRSNGNDNGPTERVRNEEETYIRKGKNT